MNGILYRCRDEIQQLKRRDHVSALTEQEEFISAIFHYIENLVNITPPRKLLYMALDGTPPSIH